MLIVLLRRPIMLLVLLGRPLMLLVLIGRPLVLLLLLVRPGPQLQSLHCVLNLTSPNADRQKSKLLRKSYQPNLPYNC